MDRPAQFRRHRRHLFLLVTQTRWQQSRALQGREHLSLVPRPLLVRLLPGLFARIHAETRA